MILKKNLILLSFFVPWVLYEGHLALLGVQIKAMRKKDQSWKSSKPHCFQHWLRLAAALPGGSWKTSKDGGGTASEWPVPELLRSPDMRTLSRRARLFWISGLHQPAISSFQCSHLMNSLPPSCSAWAIEVLNIWFLSLLCKSCLPWFWRRASRHFVLQNDMN